MVLRGPIMCDSLYILLTSVSYINILHRSFPACNPLWFWIRTPIDIGFTPRPFGHVLGISHPWTQFYILEVADKQEKETTTKGHLSDHDTKRRYKRFPKRYQSVLEQRCPFSLIKVSIIIK